MQQRHLLYQIVKETNPAGCREVLISEKTSLYLCSPDFLISSNTQEFALFLSLTHTFCWLISNALTNIKTVLLCQARSYDIELGGEGALILEKFSY